MKGDNQITIEEENIEDSDTQKYNFYQIDDTLYCLDNINGDIYHVQFDDNSTLNEESNDIEEEEEEQEEEQEEDVIMEEEEPSIDTSSNTDEQNLTTNNKHAIKNIEKGGCDMDFEMKETSETKPDGSEAMKERRITQCMEETGKDRKACTEMVRKKMHEKGAEVVNPEDMTKEDEVKEDTIETKEDEVEETKDTIEICPKELDMLKSKAEELEALKAEKEEVENELKSFKEDFLAFKKRIDDKEANEKELERQDIIKRISHDFDIPEDEMAEDSIGELEKFEKRLVMALKRNSDEEEKEDFGTTEDYKEIGDRIHKRYFLEV